MSGGKHFIQEQNPRRLHLQEALQAAKVHPVCLRRSVKLRDVNVCQDATV